MSFPLDLRTPLATTILFLGGACAVSAPATRVPPRPPLAPVAPVIPGPRAQEEAPLEVDGSSLGALLRRARASHPGLRAAFHRWQEADERVGQAGVLPEPRLTLTGYLDEIETRTGPLDARVTLQQRFPWFGELDAERSAAAAEAQAAGATLEALRLDVDRQVRHLWYERAWLERAIAVSRGHLELLTHWEGVARSRLETGIGSYADLVRSQVELGDLEVRLATLRDMRRPLLARMNALLDRAPDDPLAVPPDPWGDLPALADPDRAGASRAEPDGERLRDELPRTSPLLRALEHRVAASDEGVRLADRAGYPDLVLGAEYSVVGSARMPGVAGSGEDPFALSLGLDLPLWRTAVRAGRDSAREAGRAARLEHGAALRRLESELESALFDHRDAARREGLYEHVLIPKGEESLESLEAAYRTGAGGFLDVIDAQRTLLEFQLQAVRARADRAQALAEVERLSGAPLFEEVPRS